MYFILLDRKGTVSQVLPSAVPFPGIHSHSSDEKLCLSRIAIPAAQSGPLLKLGCTAGRFK